MNDKFEAEIIFIFKEINIEIKVVFEYEEIFPIKNQLNSIRLYLENKQDKDIIIQRFGFEYFENNSESFIMNCIEEPIVLNLNNHYDKEIKISSTYFDDFFTSKENSLKINILYNNSYFEENIIKFNDLKNYRINNLGKRVPL